MNQSSADNTETTDLPEAGLMLSPQQQRLWQLRESNPVYRVRCVVEIAGALDRVRLEEAVRQVAEAHEILHATFVRRPGSRLPLQASADRITWDEDRDLSSLPLTEQAACFDRLWTELIELHANSKEHPALRLQLVRLDAAKHRLLLGLSPLCGDAAALDLLFTAIASAYAVLSEAGHFKYEGLQYARFAQWQNELIETPDPILDDARAYWRTRFPITPDLDLPLRRELPRFPGFTPDRVALPIGANLRAEIASGAARLEITDAEFLLTTWYAFLWRWTKDDSASIGYVSDGRTYDELRGVMGLLARCLPIHAPIAGAMPFSTLAAGVPARLRDALEWQDYFLFAPASNGPDASPRTLSLAFEYEERSGPQAAGGLVWTPCLQEALIEPFHLKLGCIREGDALTAQLVYDASLYDLPDVERLLQGWLVLVREAARHSERRIDRLPLLGEEEYAELCVRFNATQRPYPDSKCLHELFEAQVLRTPDAVAVRLGAERLTYRELNERAGRLAGYLQAFGVGSETRVALCLTRSPDLVVAILAVLKAGGAYVPLDASYPLERLTQILEDVMPVVVLTRTDLSDRLPGSSTPIVCLDSDAPLIDSMEFNPAVGVGPENLAYVIYTSGSTGRPKGVMIPHQGLVNYLHWCAETYQVRSGSGTLVDTPVGFDLTITSLLSPLLVGQTAVLVPEEDGLEGLVAALQRERNVTLVKTTPSYLEVLRNLLPAEAAGTSRLYIIGGEALRWDTLSFWKFNAPATRLVNEYGPTETVVGCCVYEAPDALGSGGSVPIGRPIANTKLYLLDAGLQPTPMGMPGELYIGGAGVARGYLHHSDLTAEKFVPDPFSEEPGARLYRTGDLCRYRPDGNLEYVDRTDNQVKVRGFRIELGEIESVLTQHPHVRETVVMAREDQPGDRRLVAYVVGRDGASDDALISSCLRLYLQERVPEYMVPSAFVSLDSLPLTSHGKVDRRSLPAPDGETAVATYTAPRTPLEEGLAVIWSEVLRIERVGIHDDFFELGGHSLMVTQVVARVRDTFQMDVPVRAVFDTPTIASLAEWMLSDPESRTRIESLAALLASLSRLSDEELAERVNRASVTGDRP